MQYGHAGEEASALSSTRGILKELEESLGVYGDIDGCGKGLWLQNDDGLTDIIKLVVSRSRKFRSVLVKRARRSKSAYGAPAVRPSVLPGVLLRVVRAQLFMRRLGRERLGSRMVERFAKQSACDRLEAGEHASND